MAGKWTNRENFRRIADLSSLGLMLPSSIAVGLFFGYLLDRWLGTGPWLLIVFLLLGVASGFLSLLRGLKRLSKDDTDDDSPPSA
jgi:ATP synthase protein I